MTNEPRIITEILDDALPVAETADSLARKLDRSNQRAALLELHARETDHRIKNSLQLVSSLMVTELRRRNPSPANVRLAASLSERIGTIARIHELLSHRQGGRIDFGSLLTELCGNVARLFESDVGPMIRVTTVDVDLDAHKATALALIANELLFNAYKHGGRGGRLSIDVRLAVAEDGVLCLSVGDDGTGVPRHDSGAGQGLGTRLIRSIAQAIGASVRLTGTADGTLVTVVLPSSPETPRALRPNDDRQGGAGRRGP